MTVRIATIATCIALTAGAAPAVTIDFTDTAIWSSAASTDVVVGATVSLSATGGALQVAGVTVNDAAPGPVGPLLGLSDGLGVGGDEISFKDGVSQSITVTFSSAVRVVGLYFLDFFVATSLPTAEVSVATFSGGEVVNTVATAPRADKIGFGQTFFAPITATSVTFTTTADNDGDGRADYALAGIEVAPIPLPSSALMFLSALAGGALLTRMRQKSV